MPSITITQSNLLSEPYVINIHINIISIRKKAQTQVNWKTFHKRIWNVGMALEQKLIELTIQHQSTPTPPTSFHIPHLPHSHPYICKHSGYQHFIALPTSHPSIPSRTHGFVFTCSTVNSKNAGAHTGNLKGGYIPVACSQCRYTWDTVSPCPILSVEPGGICGTKNTKNHYFKQFT